MAHDDANNDATNDRIVRAIERRLLKKEESRRHEQQDCKRGSAPAAANVIEGDVVTNARRNRGKDVKSTSSGTLRTSSAKGLRAQSSVAKAPTPKSLQCDKVDVGPIAPTARTYSAKSLRAQSSVATAPTPRSLQCDKFDAGPTSPTERSLRCDKCDGGHATEHCPYFRKARSKHSDAWTNFRRSKSAPPSRDNKATIIKNSSARIVPQPGDGSCLFHSLSYGLKDASTAKTLRKDVANYIAKHPDIEIADTPIKDWIKYDSSSSVRRYSMRMKGSSWGGGIELAAVAQMKNVNVHVYETCKEGYKRISSFDRPGSDKTVSVLYRGRAHYDALVV